jgi:hypothetical protein
VSTDGNAWTQVGTATIIMRGNIYVGLPVTSHTNTALCAATFTNVSVIASSPPPMFDEESEDDETQVNTAIALSPNPLRSNVLLVQSENESQENVRIQVVDLSGKIIREKDFTGDTEQAGYEVDMADIAQGAYIIRMISPTKNVSSLLIRQ